VVVISARYDTQRARRQVAVSRLDELRAVLDEAASDAASAHYEANGVWSLLEQDRDEPDPKSVFTNFSEHLNAAGNHRLRIALRVGETSELSTLYDDILKPLWALWEAQAASLHNDAWFDAEAAKRLLEHADTAKSTFLNRASELVGPDLELLESPLRKTRLR
jgi:hypothetical protein